MNEEALAHWGLSRQKQTNKNAVDLGVLCKPVPENMIVYVDLDKEWPVIQYEDGDYHNGDGKLDVDNDKIIFNVRLVKFHVYFCSPS